MGAQAILFRIIHLVIQHQELLNFPLIMTTTEPSAAAAV